MEFETIQPESAGMSSTRLCKAEAYAHRVSDELGGTGGAVLVLRHGKIAGEWYWGTRGPGNPHPFDAETLTPVYSVTKGFTATALALLIEDGLLWLDDPAWLYLPEMKEGDLAKVTLRHLATHSSGYPGGDQDFYGCWKDQRPGESLPDTYFRHAMMRVDRGLVFPPGTSHIYSDPAVAVLGEALFRASGMRVPELVHKRVFEPLGLKRIGWSFADETLLGDIAEVVNMGWLDHLTDLRKWMEGQFVAGGLISSARDLAACGQMLLGEGILNGVRVLSPLAVRMMTTCQYPQLARHLYPHRGLFWWIKAAPDSPEMGHLVPSGSYAHGGAGHSVLVVMPALDIVAVMIRNRAGNPPGFLYDRDYPIFMDLVAASVEEL